MRNIHLSKRNKRCRLLLLFVIGLGVISGAKASRYPVIQTPQKLGETVKLTLPAASEDFMLPQANWNTRLKIYVDSEHCCEQTTPVQGRYRMSENIVEFQPDFPFSKGIPYRVMVDFSTALSRGNNGLKKTFTIANTVSAPETQIDRIYPSGEQLPENLLRFYIYFTNPMKAANSLKHIKLFDHQGIEIKDVFLRYKQELWSPDYKRLTLPFEPGRIKRGVGQNLKVGPALHENLYYKLVIDQNWRDAEGRKLKSTVEKVFKVTKPIRNKVDPTQWALHPPSPLSREPLWIELLRPHDHALLKKLIHILNSDGQIVEGNIELDQHQRIWSFKPNSIWANGTYSIDINARLEDVAGNNVYGPLDRALMHSPKKSTVSGNVRLDFKVGL